MIDNNPINNKYSAAIIGAGSIGALKPDKFDYPGGDNVLTVAHAFHNHPNISLDMIVDKDLKKAQKASEKWSATLFDFHVLSRLQIDPDIIAVCVNTEFHFTVLKQILTYAKPKLIMCEKPFCSNLKEAQGILNIAKSAGIPIQVDYLRRFELAHIIMRDDIKDGRLKVQHAKLTYTRGLVHEACHAINLFDFWFGEFLSGEILSTDGIADRDSEDLTLPVYLKYENCPHVFMCPIDGRLYGAFEIELYTDQGVFRFAQNGTIMAHTPVVPEPTYGDYKSLGFKQNIVKTGLTSALNNMAHNCIDNMNGTHALLSPAEDAIKVHEVYNSLGI